MKKLVLFVTALSVVLAVASCGKKKEVTGHFDGLKGDSLKVEVYDVLSTRVPLISLIVPATGGDFAFDLNDTIVRMVRLSDPAATEEGNEYAGSPAVFYYVPGENAVISGRLDSTVIAGSKYYSDKKAYDEICAEDQAKIQEVIKEIRGAATEEVRDSVMEIYNGLYAHVTELTKNFVKEHPASLYSANLVGRLIGEDGKDALEALEAMPESVRNSALKPLIDRSKATAEKTKARSEAALLVKDGMQAPDFTLKNEKGEDFTLSSIYNKGKYIILDFWGDWCYWCKKGIPDMKQLYKDAKGKIEILSVDCGDKEEVWLNSIKENELPWLHVYNPGEGTADLAVTYAIQGYPTKIILNPDGTINKTIVGEDPEFYTYVKSLIKK